jgi:hypothetical protein
MTPTEKRVYRAAMRDAKQVSREILGYVALEECASYLRGTSKDVILACAADAAAKKKGKKK